jgi:hypothetical protein
MTTQSLGNNPLPEEERPVGARPRTEHKNILYGPVRLIHEWDLLVFENALSWMLHPVHAAGCWPIRWPETALSGTTQARGRV